MDTYFSGHPDLLFHFRQMPLEELFALRGEAAPAERVAFARQKLAELAENRSVAVPIAMRRQIDANDMQPEPFHPDAVICMNGIRVGLSNTASPQFIEAVIRCLSHAE